MKCSFAIGLRLGLISFAASSSSVAAVSTPVERVVTLLKDIEAKLRQDNKEEQQAYDKYACWCEKTTERKAHAITDGQDELRKYGQTILTLKGRIATLAAEIEHHEMHIKANKEAQASATNIRQKENAVYAGDTAEMKQAILALQQAITVLAEGTLPESTSLLQASTQASSAIRSVIGALPQHMSMRPGQIAELESFLEESSRSKYMPQSMTVQGILTDMYRTFAQDLETATLEEASANRKYEDFIHAQEVELARLEREKAKREAEKLEKESQLADNQQIYDDTAAQEKADIAFFDQTKQACLNKHDAWMTRSSLRQEEYDGIVEALDILTSDSARELFASAIKEGKEVRAQDSYDTGRDITAFLQERSVVSDEAAPMLAFAELKKQAASAHSFRLAALAVRVRAAKVGHFDKVLIAIDDMIGTLQQEGADDIAKRDQCKDEYQKIESKIKNVTWLIQKNEAKIDKLERIIKKRTEQKHQTIAEIDDVDAVMAELTRVREAENEAFLNAKTEDQNAIDLLIEARAALSRYYKNNSIDMGPIQGAVKGLALQQQGPDFDISADQAPETVFSGKGKRKNEAKGILQILTTIIEDLNDEIRNDMKAEEEAQLEFEGLMKEGRLLRKELVAKEVSLTEAIAKRNVEKTAEKQDKTENEEDLQEEQDYKASITDDCDFVIRTFEKRAAARTAEMNGLVGAKEYLAGYQKNSEAALLERGSLPRPAFDDSALSRMKFLGVEQ